MSTSDARKKSSASAHEMMKGSSSGGDRWTVSEADHTRMRTAKVVMWSHSHTVKLGVVDLTWHPLSLYKLNMGNRNNDKRVKYSNHM